MSFKGAIFDLDGVIVDTVPLHFAAWRYLFEEKFGVPFTKLDYEAKVDGKPRIDGVLSVLTHLSREEATAAGDIKQERYLGLLHQDEIIKFASSFALIEELLKHKILLATASSSKNAPYILEKVGLARKMRAIVCGTDIVYGKPHPEIFLKAASELGLDASECVVFEDAKSGVEAAKAGGFFCVGIDRHNQPQNYVLADLVIKDLLEVNYEILAEKLFNFEKNKQQR